MENATQALLIGTGVLIAVIVLSMGVYLFYVFGGQAANTQDKIDEQQLAKFNNEFLKYTGSTTLTIQDIITAKNYALQNNEQYAGYNVDNDRAAANNHYVDVYYHESKSKATSGDKRYLIMDDSDETLLNNEMIKIKADKDPKRFSCKTSVNSRTGRVNKVYFFAN